MTYCCKHKAKISPDTLVTPSELYLSARIQNFIAVCNTKQLEWVIFSDLYGIIESHKKIHSYDKAPYEVTDADYRWLLEVTIKKILSYNKVYFYYNADSFHPLYRRLVGDMQKYREVLLFDNLGDI